MSDLLSKAIAIAQKAHYDQYDIGCEAYILHPFYVMSHMTTKTEKIVAVLHDVIEDCPKFAKEIERTFNDWIVKDIYLLSKSLGEDYPDYITSIKSSSLATRVKIIDLEHNMDVKRIKRDLDQRDFDRLKKYHKAWQFLSKE